MLVDTKYEMGRSPDGSVVLVDEVGFMVATLSSTGTAWTEST